MHKSWEKREFKNFFESQLDGRNNRQTLINNQLALKNAGLLIKYMKEADSDDLEELIDWVVSTNISMTEEERNEFYEILCQKTDYNSAEEIKNDIRNCRIYREVYNKQKKYMNELNIDDVIHAITQNTLPLEESVKYLLAHYCKHFKPKEDSYFQKHQKASEDIRHLLYAAQQHHSETLLETAYLLKAKEDQLLFSIKEKKINKTITKSMTKLQQLYKREDITLSELQYNIQKLQEETQARIQQHVSPDQYDKFTKITEFFLACDNIPKHFQVTSGQNTPNEQTKTEEEINLDIIERFFMDHHLYYKKSQILQEIKDYPPLIQFYHFYEQAAKNQDPETRIRLLEELASDIRDSGKKNTETLRRLFTSVQREIEETVEQAPETEKSEEEIMEEEIIQASVVSHQEEEKPTAQIGKHTVYLNSVQKNPMNLQKLVDLLAPESRSHIRFLESLIYQIGYDKVQAYLNKAPQELYIEDLDAIIRLDRQLRFEYQRVLEDIEMYFRSSLTYYLTNKYDEKYATPNKDMIFYKRSYLMHHIFTDPEEHFQHISQLNDRIDAEVKNGNQQVINEFRKYKYALPFSTAAGIMTFGWLIIFFDNLNYNDKLDYLRTYYYHVTPQTFSSWMNSLSALRNRCAHYYSLYRISSLKELRPIMTKDIDGNAFDDDFKHSSLFYYTIIMARLAPDVYNIEDFIDNIGILFRKASRENGYFDLLTDYSFPKSWRQILENEKNAKVRVQTMD